MPVSNKLKIAKIIIKPLHLNQGLSNSEVRALYFPCIITQFKDNYESKWDEEDVYGRMDPIGSFGGIKRKINLSFRVISNTADEAVDNMSSISSLIQYFFPVFSDKKISGNTSVLKKPPFFDLKMLNLIESTQIEGKGLQGYFLDHSIDTDVQSEDNAFYIDSGGGVPALYYTDCVVNLSLRVLHEKPIGWYQDFDMPRKYPYGRDNASINAELQKRAGYQAEAESGEAFTDIQNLETTQTSMRESLYADLLSPHNE